MDMTARPEGQLEDRLREARAQAEELKAQCATLEAVHREWLAAFDGIPDPIFMHDGELRIVRANRAYAEHADMDIKAILGRPYWEVFPRRDGPLPGCEKNRNCALPRESDVVLPNGKVFRSRAYHVSSPNSPAGLQMHVMEDITARRLAEQRVTALRTAIEELSVQTDLAAVGRKAVEASIKLTGAHMGTVAAVQGESGTVRYQWHSGLPPEVIRDIESHPAPVAAGLAGLVLETQASQIVENYPSFERALPQYLRVGVQSALGVPIRAGGEIAGALVVASLGEPRAFDPEQVPIVEAIARQLGVAIQRHRLTESLRSSRDFLRGLTDHALEAIYAIDPEGRVLLLNRAGSEITGYASEEIRGRHFSTLLDEKGAAQLADQFARVVEGRAVIVNQEVEIVRKDGARRCVEYSLVPLVEGDRVVSIVGTAADVTRRKEAETALRENEEKFRTMAGAALDAVFMLDSQGNVTYSNPAATRMLGYAEHDILGKSAHTILTPDRYQDSAQRGFAHFAATGHGPVLGKTVELEAVRKDGGKFPVELAVSACRLHGEWHAVGVMRDITDRKQAEQALHQANRGLNLLTTVNEALVRATEEPRLLRAICQAIVETGGYRMAWVGYASHDKDKTIQPVAHAGHEDGYLDTLKLTWTDKPRGRGPAGAAIRAGAPVIVQDILHDPRFKPWRAQAGKRGYKASIALPLTAGGHCFGALNIYAGNCGAFGDDELALLKQLAEDLAFGITTQRHRVEEMQAVAALKESEHRFRAVFDSASDGILLIDPRDRSVYACNDRLCELLGYTQEESKGLDLSQIYPAEMMPQMLNPETPRKGARLRSVVPEIRVKRKDGAFLYVEVSLSRITVKAYTYLLHILRDVTERHRAEEERRRNAEQIQRTLVQTIQAVALTVEKRDPYTSGHQQRVADLAVQIARELGLEDGRIEGLRLGALIHDIGKIWVPAEILNRPGLLSDMEMGMIKTHSQVGYEIMKDVEFPWPVAEMILQHHERLDGGGYPKGLKGDAIIQEARILAVADVVEAMASHRPYRPGLGVEAALQEVETHKGTRYDAEAVDACLRLFRGKGYKFQRT